MVGIVLAAAEDSTRVVLPHADELIWGSIAFVILFAFLAKAAFPKLKQSLDARTEKIKGSLESAEKAKSDADALLDQYRQQLADARNEANRIIEEGKRTAEALRRDLSVKAEAEAQEIVARARAEVGSERDRAIQELRGTVGDLSLELASRVIERELSDPQAQRALVDRAIADLARTGGNGQTGDGSA